LGNIIQWLFLMAESTLTTIEIRLFYWERINHQITHIPLGKVIVQTGLLTAFEVSEDYAEATKKKKSMRVPLTVEIKSKSDRRYVPVL
jgi:hypothetical protein